MVLTCGKAVAEARQPHDHLGRAGSGDSAPFSSWSMNVALLPDSGGPPVAISTWRGATESYGAAGHEGQAAMHFTIGHPGRYLLVAQNAIPRSITDVAVGRGIGR